MSQETPRIATIEDLDGVTATLSMAFRDDPVWSLWAFPEPSALEACTTCLCSAPRSLYTIGFPLSAVATSGAAPPGLAFVGLQVAGADCVVNGVLWP
jgi:hypothetical protein